jgi:hypothetical protein
VPTASIVTIEEPEIDANSAQVSTQATPSPPGRRRVSASMTPIRRRAVVPRVITDPHSMNSGIDRISSLSSPTQMSSMM